LRLGATRLLQRATTRTLGLTLNHRARYRPAELLAKYRAIREQISDKEFFRSPKHQKTQEIWCAAHFASAFDQYLDQCDILIDDTDTQTEADFDLCIKGVSYPFQITEVMEPERRRRDEYRHGLPTVRADDWSRGSQLGPSWIKAAIEKKLQKQYAGAKTLNLLAYLNFGAWEQQYVDIRNECASVSMHFASVWLLNGNAMCCIQPSSILKAFEGWMMIPESLARVEP
jgi:hypothetical protein